MKIYLATEMGGSPFTNIKSQATFGFFKCVFINKLSKADVVVAHNFRKLLPLIIRYPKKKYLVWTNEPRFDTSLKDQISLPFNFATIQIMNVYGKDVFWHNLHFLGSYHFDNSNNLGIDINKSLYHLSGEQLGASGKMHKIAAIFTNNAIDKTGLIQNGIDIDLHQQRCRYALKGHERNIVDIYGNRWPKGMALDNSGFGFEKSRPWWIEKLGILSRYKFNLCFENTAYPHYITEKIWHAIVSHNLPVYNSFNSSIYEIFPENSFVDSSRFNNEHELFDYIAVMPVEEYLGRLNACIDVFNRMLAVRREHFEHNEKETTEKIINRILA